MKQTHFIKYKNQKNKAKIFPVQSILVDIKKISKKMNGF